MVDEPTESSFVGAEVVLPPNALVFGNRAFVRVGGIVFSATKVDKGEDLDDWAATRATAFLIADGRAFIAPQP